MLSSVMPAWAATSVSRTTTSAARGETAPAATSSRKAIASGGDFTFRDAANFAHHIARAVTNGGAGCRGARCQGAWCRVLRGHSGPLHLALSTLAPWHDDHCTYNPELAGIVWRWS